LGAHKHDKIYQLYVSLPKTGIVAAAREKNPDGFYRDLVQRLGRARV